MLIGLFAISLFLMQVLDHWYQKLPPSYTVGDLVDAVTNWQQRGFLDRDVFSTLTELVIQDTSSGR